jgi:hypothetical protein
MKRTAKTYLRMLNAVQLLEIHGMISDSEKKRAAGRIFKAANGDGFTCLRLGFRDYKFVRAVPAATKEPTP